MRIALLVTLLVWATALPPSAIAQESSRWVRVAKDVQEKIHYYDRESLVWEGPNACRIFVTIADEGEIPTANRALLYVLHRDRTYEMGYTGKPGNRYPIKPESVLEALWNQAFKH